MEVNEYIEVVNRTSVIIHLASLSSSVSISVATAMVNLHVPDFKSRAIFNCHL